MEIDATQLHIKLVEHSVITHAHLEFWPTLQSLMWERLQPRTHFIHFALHDFADVRGKIVECAGEGGRPDLERGSHVLLGLARRENSSGDFAAGFVQLGFHLVGQLKLVFEEVINPCAKLLNLRTLQSRNSSFNFLNCTHGGKIATQPSFAKSGFAKLGWHDNERGDSNRVGDLIKLMLKKGL